MKKRAAIFAFYDKAGIVDRYVIYLLRELLKVVDKLVIVCNGELSDAGRKVFNELTEDVLTRENEGFDAWAIKTGLEYIGWDKLKQYDELVLLNDTVYGPIYPFEIMFDEMNKRNLDFWGITKHGEYHDPYGLTKKGIFPEHIQSYFIAIDKNMFSHPEYQNYWSDLRKFKSWKETVALHEVQFTKHFAELGFKWDVYISPDKELSDYSDVSLILQMAYELVKNRKCPVIKRKSFSIDYGNFFLFTLGTSNRKAYDYIREYTDYDTDMIWENILRTSRLKDIKDNFHLNYTLPKKYIKDKTVSLDAVNTALFAHLTYEDQVEFCAAYASSIVDNADVYITTNSEHMSGKLDERFRSIKCKNLRIDVLPEESKGRDVGALWVTLRPYMERYDYICFMHNKKSSQDKPMTVGRGFAERCLENTLASKDYVANILGLFETEPRMGMLFPPPVIHGVYQFHITNFWGLNYGNTVKLADKLNINVPIDNNADPLFPSGGMFWFRPKALKKLVDYDWQFDDFPDEPLPVDGSLGHAFERLYCYAAQSEGFYSAWVMTDEFTSSEITSLSYLLAKSKTSIMHRILDYTATNLRRYPRLFVILRRVYRFFGKINQRLRG